MNSLSTRTGRDNVSIMNYQVVDRSYSNQASWKSIIYDVLRTTAQHLTDGEHISVNDVELSRQRKEFIEATTRSDKFQDFANTAKIERYAYEATMRILQDHRAHDTRLGGLHYMCISHVLSPRQWDEAEAEAAGVHSAVHATRRLVARINLSSLTLLLLTNEARVSVSHTGGFLTYLHSWVTIVDNTLRDAQTKEALQQIVDTGVTGETCTAAHRSAPHDRCWSYKVQMSLIAITPLATELYKLDSQNGNSVVTYKYDDATDNVWQEIDGTYRSSRQELGNVSDILAQNIGGGTVTEHTRACMWFKVIRHGFINQHSGTTWTIHARCYRYHKHGRVREPTVETGQGKVTNGVNTVRRNSTNNAY